MQRFNRMVDFSLYEISNDGIIRKVVTKEIISQRVHPGYGYKMCDLQDNDLKVRTVYPHKEVARAYIPTKKKGKLYVIHINGKQQDNRVNNLQWATPAEAQLHQLKMGFRKRLGNPELYKFSKYWKAKHAKKGKGKVSESKTSKGKLKAKGKVAKASLRSPGKLAVAKRNSLVTAKRETAKTKIKPKKQATKLKGSKVSVAKKSALKKKGSKRRLSKLEKGNARITTTKKTSPSKKVKPKSKLVRKPKAAKKGSANKNLTLKQSSNTLAAGIRKPLGKTASRRGKRQRIKYRKVLSSKPK